MELEQVRQGQEEKGQKHPPHNPLLSPYKMGNFQLSHRVVLVPLTRQRSFDNIPQPHAALNYSQRTSKGGLLIAEATMVSDTAQGYPFTPGILTKEQVEAWKPIVDVVHAKSGIFFCQIWHAERVSNQVKFWPFCTAGFGVETFIGGGGYGRENGMRAVVENHTDLVAYGRFFLANPDLPRRFELNASLNKYNRETFYTHDPVVGYIDYPFLEEINA